MKNLILLLWALCAAFDASSQIKTGAERTEIYMPLLNGKRVAVLANHTSIMADGTHLVDTLKALGVNIVGILSPEHGFRGTADAGEHVQSATDAATGIAVWSLYSGKSRRPSDEQMQAFDVLVVDMQDVGLRFYTYYITMLRMIDACADFNRQVVVLDRPNPNGMYVDGPILEDKYRSGVGALPIPVVHGMTLGEIARMAIGESWVKCAELSVVPCSGYERSMRYRLPVAPSPNLKSMRAIYLYPSTCLFEGTVCSLGRGTDAPFEMYGSPLMTGYAYSFTPRATAGAKNPPLKDTLCHGVDLRSVDEDKIIASQFDLSYVIDAYRNINIGDKFFTPFFEKLVGVGYVRQMIEQGADAATISARWQADVERFKLLRAKYLLYE